MSRTGPDISLTNRQRKVALDLPWLRTLAVRALPLALASPGAGPRLLPELDALEITLLGQAAISRINAQFLGHEGPTDVITFQHGEILIGAETARENAARHGKPLNHEVALYMIHGLLHLHGWSDKEPAEARRMARTQETILAAVLSSP